MTDLWICCSLFQIEDGDWAKLPQVILTINQQREAHLHTLSWWLSAICQNSVVISGVSQGGAGLDAPACHQRACPRLVRTLPNWAAACWWNSPVRYPKLQKSLQLNKHESRTRKTVQIFTMQLNSRTSPNLSLRFFWWKLVQSDIVAQPRWVMLAHRASLLHSSPEFTLLFTNNIPTNSFLENFWIDPWSDFVAADFRTFFLKSGVEVACVQGQFLLWNFPGLWTGGGLLSPVNLALWASSALIPTAGTSGASTLAGTGRRGRL